MTIFRTEHKKNYTCINNFIVKDTRLSWRAKGVWLYAFSRIDDWSFNEEDIIKQSTEGRDAVRSALKELEECGYLLRERGKENNKFKKVEWVFYETPREIKKMFTTDGFPVTGNPSTGNQGVENSQVIASEEIHTPHTYTPSTEILNTEQQQQVVVPAAQKDLCKSDIFKMALKKDWASREIEEAWDIYQANKNIVSSPFDYIEGVIQKKRMISNSKQTKIKEKLCTSKKPIETLQEKRANSERKFSENATKINLLETYMQQEREKCKKRFCPS